MSTPEAAPIPNRRRGTDFCPHVDQDGLETIVPSGASGGPQPQFAEANGSVIQNDQNFRVIDPMVTGIVCDGLAAEIHEGLWLHEHAAATQCATSASHFGFKPERDRSPAGKLLDDQKTRVVARADELPARIPETDDKTKDG